MKIRVFPEIIDHSPQSKDCVYIEIEIPVIPVIGDVVWLSYAQEEELTNKLNKLDYSETHNYPDEYINKDHTFDCTSMRWVIGRTFDMENQCICIELGEYEKGHYDKED